MSENWHLIWSINATDTVTVETTDIQSPVIESQDHVYDLILPDPYIQPDPAIYNILYLTVFIMGGQFIQQLRPYFTFWILDFVNKM